MSGYPQTLIYFIWPWQVHFLIACQIKAEGLFNILDKTLEPGVFFIGFIDNNTPNAAPICYEPEKMDFLADDLQNVRSFAAEFDANDPDRDMFYTGQGVMEEMERRRYNKNFRQAIKVSLDSSGHFEDKVHFISEGIRRNGYFVYIILQLKKSVYDSYVYLRYKDPEERIYKRLSFIEAIQEVYLEDCQYRLFIPDAGKNNGPDRDAGELLSNAAGKFVFTVGWCGRSDGYYKLFNACNQLSQIRYEGTENAGHLIVARKNHPSVKMTLEIETPVDIGEFRKVRKILQLSNDTTAVITDASVVYGLGTLTPGYDSSFEDAFHVYFRGVHAYDIYHQDQCILQMRFGVPSLAKDVIDKSQFTTDVKRIFTSASDENIKQMYVLASIAAKHTRGAMLVFVDDAAQEAKRLGRQCINIKPVKLDQNLITNLTSIDGALIVDLNGYAHAKGVILDGIVGLSGDAARGSRYNSALTYVDHRGWEKPTMVIVISEDGMVDVIPALMPLIDHQEISDLINMLDKLNSETSFDRQAFYNTMQLLNKRKFYLTRKECDTVNEKKRQLEHLDRHSGQNTMWISHADFVPNPRMYDRYYSPSGSK